jgi:hypothetical protein
VAGTGARGTETGSDLEVRGLSESVRRKQANHQRFSFLISHSGKGVMTLYNVLSGSVVVESQTQSEQKEEEKKCHA